jgi:CheY-like chemotaxis protein
VNGDWNRLAQVVGNLLTNAGKFTAAGGSVTVSVGSDPATGKAFIRVADTGVGIAPETLSRLFEPFVQADTTLDRSKGGLGLGLALIKGLVDLHGGTVEGRSAGLGHGAEFTVLLPLDVNEPAAATGSSAAHARARCRVLVIEDSVDAANSMRELLELEGQEVAVACEGREGVAKARELRPDLVLCDLGLPGMSGYEVAGALRAESSLVGTLLVAVSGYALPEDVDRAAAAGFDRHLAKPASLGQLATLLAEAASRRFGETR